MGTGKFGPICAGAIGTIFYGIPMPHEVEDFTTEVMLMEKHKKGGLRIAFCFHVIPSIKSRLSMPFQHTVQRGGRGHCAFVSSMMVAWKVCMC